MLYGYARVSTEGQTLDAQRELLDRAGCAKVFAEKQSGAKTDRPMLAKALAALDPGDVLVVTRLDRLARSTRDLLNAVALIEEKGANFKSLADAWADTTSAHGRLMLTILGGLAEFERSLILSRTREGKRRAVERGVRMGPKPKLGPKQVEEVRRRAGLGETARELGEIYGVSHMTILRALK